MNGLRLFARQLRRSPLRALARLSLDYLVFVGIVAYCLALWLSSAPLAFAERVSGRPLRQKLLDRIGKMARAE